MRFAKWIVGGWIVAATIVQAGPPQIDHVQLENQRLQDDLEKAVERWLGASSEPSWLGWHVPMIDGDQVLCCGGGADWRRREQVCELEGTHRHLSFSSRQDPVTMVRDESLVVLLRGGGGRIDDLQVFSDGCPLDAGGRRMTWLEEVDPDDSVAFLGEIITGSRLVGGRDRLEGDALMALALHAAPTAGERLILAAQSDPDPEVRGEAMFWLAQTDSPGASDVIFAALERDAEAGVREEAIFALSQLPEGRGVPLLLGIAQDPARPSSVRQTAFFWFVQEGDDRALDLIAEILNR
jgi:hypothetical protein